MCMHFVQRAGLLRGATLQSFINNHDELMELWKWSLSVTKDTEMRGRIIGAKTMMKTFGFLFGCAIGKTLLTQTDNVSEKLQTSKLAALEAQTFADLTVTTMMKDRNDERFDNFWDYVIRMQKQLSINDPKPPRKRKIPARFDENQETYHFPTTAKEKYRAIYYECIDVLVSSIKARFDQPDYKIYVGMQELLFKGFKGEIFEEELIMLKKRYADDINMEKLETQLYLLPGIAEGKHYSAADMNIMDINKLMQSLTPAEREFISEVTYLVKLILLAPATNAVSERSFSSLKRLKTYMRSTMGDDRLEHLMVLHIHRDLTDKLNLVEIANEFVGKNERRRQIFGTFTANDIPQKKTYRSVGTQARFDL